ncbi:MAG: hypothetical protein K2Q18_02560 [Bdellovibrionales bacterium]|nr:hypothetical protein [Bdellovibrionales bacterium]
MHIKEKLHLHLMKTYKLKLARNNRYSLRSYAKFLAIDASLLCKIFNHKRAIGKETAEKILNKIPDEELLKEFETYVKSA